MGLIRLIVILLAAWLVWKLYKGYKARQLASRKTKTRTLPRGKMVKCEYCEVHLPEANAVSHEELWFCNQQHRAKFLSQHSR